MRERRWRNTRKTTGDWKVSKQVSKARESGTVRGSEW